MTYIAYDVGRDPVWYRDVSVLFRRPLEFFPSRDQTAEERVNSMVRLLTYCGLAVFAYNRRPKYLVFTAFAIALVSLAHRSYRSDTITDFVDKESRSVARLAFRDGGKGKGSPGAKTEEKFAPVQRRESTTTPRDSQAGKACTWSTAKNPFANVLLTDYVDNPDRPPACKYDVMKKDIRANFNRNLIRDAGDVFEKQNSQRQYYTMPVTTTYADTLAFAEFAYGRGRGCKDDTSKCTGFVG
jgi:hypothetical protein